MTMPDRSFQLFEISWEVCNKVGGIHTVLSSKAVTAVDNIGRKDFARVTDKKLTGAHYVHINFTAPADAPQHLREKLRLNGSVYRTFIQSA